MNVQGVNNNQNFGMALHMEDTKVIKRILGNKIAKDFEDAKPALKEMAKDVDIFVKPSSFVHSPVLPKDYINVVVQQKDITLKDRAKRLFGLRPPYRQEDFLPANMSSSERIIEKAQTTKQNLLNYIG